MALRWRHNGLDSVSNHQPPGCLLNRLFRRKSKKTSKLRVTGLCAGNSPGTGEFSAQMASYAENVSIWWRHHGTLNLSTATAFHHCPLWSEWGCSSHNQILKHPFHGLRCSRMRILSIIYVTDLIKLAYKMDTFYISGELFFSPGAKWIRSFFHTWISFYCIIAQNTN